MIANVSFEETTYAAPPLRFEAGTPIIASAIGLKSALDWMTQIGLAAIAAHEKVLLHQTEKALLQIPGLRIIGTAPQKGPVVTFAIDGIHPLDLATYLDLKGISIRSGHLCAQPLLRTFGLESAARASFALYNTAEDVEALLAAVRRIALRAQGGSR